MRTSYCLSFLIWTCMIHEVHTSPSPKRTNMYLQTERIMGLSKDHGKALHRSKRGWMWNQFFLLEEYTGPDTQYVGKLHTDQDMGDGNLKYILTGEGAGSLFVIDENTGDIHAAKKLDREEKSLYVLRAKAIDRKTGRQVEPESEFIIKIHDINDNEPKFTKDIYTASVPEKSSVGTSVIQVTATDADDANYGNSAKVVYSILQGQPYFAVDPETGIIKTALPDMSRENREQYQVVIQAKDMGGQMGGLSGTTTVNITLTDVNDNPPRFPQSTYQFSSLESAPLGSSLGRIKANDPDMGENAEIEYSIAPGDGSDVFDIITDKDTQEGIITVKKLIQTISAVDKDEPPRGHKFFFELVPEYTVHPNFSIVDNKDNTAGVITRRNGYSRNKMSTYVLPVVIFDNDYPIQSSTGTLTIRVCTCDSRGNMQSCNAEALLLPAGLSTGALVAILLCIVILLVLVVLFAAMKRQRKKEPLIISKDDVRDNIVTYNDEGGGEEDTQAFDIGTLRNPEAREESKMRRDVMPETIFQIRRTVPLWENIDVQDFIHRRLKENDLDPTAPPYDSLATYAYEGNDSIANSLSSLESLTTDGGNQDYDYLSDWGPRFKKLADMYGGDESDQD
uniref:cadherin-9-like isoform X2 n=1 Tax=Podarcis muralis TaxID=64176 RepID=UPI00109FA327|nr:cadherin-9-like isoform X2 [Podarcis muralis]